MIDPVRSIRQSCIDFNDPNDERALHKLQECFPDRKLVAIDSRALVWGLGSFHCLTQQVPVVRPARHHH